MAPALDPGAVLPALVAVPLAAALATLASPRAGARAAILASLANLALVALALGAIGARVQIAGWAAPLGIGLRLDGLAWVFLAASATVFALAAIAGRATLAEDTAATLWTLLIAGVNAVFLGADLFNLFVGLEVVSLSAAALTALGAGREAAEAGLRYLLVAVGAGLLYLMAVAVLYRATGALDIALVAEAGLGGAALAAPLALATAGLLLKSGVAPFHFWLPPAHASAAPAVSAVLSAVVVKTGLYLLFRLWSELAPAEAFERAAPLFVALGLAAILIGDVGALRAVRVKALVAYSTVAQIGFIVLALGLAALAPGAGVAFAAFVCAHALAKAGLFVAAGLVVKANGHDEVARLRDPGAAYGPTKAAIALAAAVLAGLPPTGGFVAKWTLAQAGAAAGLWWVPPVLVVAGLLTAAYMTRLASALMRTAPEETPAGAAPSGASPHPAPTPAASSGAPAAGKGRPRGWSALALTLAALGLGFLGGPLATLAGAAR